jgi:urea carboxylase-associated protein 2
MSVAPQAVTAPLWEETLPGGAHWSAVIRRGILLRLIAQGDDANVAALFYNREQPLERYNMADTLKAQHTAHLTTGFVCYSDMGRILCSIVDDSCGWHDPLCGLTDQRLIDETYGDTNFQQHRNARYVSGREGMLVELGKYGLGERDLVANINFFSKVVVGDLGTMRLESGHSRTGQYVELRFEMDTLVLLHAGPHPLSKGRPYAPAGVLMQARRAATPGPDDVCRTRCPENARGFINTERYCLATGGAA